MSKILNENIREILLNEEESKPFKNTERTRKDCFCGYKNLKSLSIYGYPHESGWVVLGRDMKYWLYQHCPKCDHEWSLTHLGVSRAIN